MGPSDYERQVTHKAVAKVARLMGYTPQGLKELCRSCNVGSEWRTIGVTRPSLVKPVERVNVRCVNGRYEFSVGNEAFALTSDALEQQRIREQVADAVVKRISEQRPAINPRFIKANQDHQPADEQGSTDALSRPETMIISPVAPRDPRGLYAPERRLTGPGNTTSAP